MKTAFAINKDSVFVYKTELIDVEKETSSKLFKSSDGGKSFKEVFRLEACNDIIGSRIIDENKLIFYTQWICEGPGGINIYKSIDGGNIWTISEIPDAKGFVLAMDFVNEFVGYCEMKDDIEQNKFYQLLTTDGGSKWEKVNLNRSIEVLQSISNTKIALDGTIYYINDEDILNRMLSGGKQWEKMLDLSKLK